MYHYHSIIVTIIIICWVSPASAEVDVVRVREDAARVAPAPQLQGQGDLKCNT